MPQDQELVWPTPPHQGYADAQAKRASSDCLIAFFDGRKLFGNILRFLPEEEVIEFRPMQDGKVLQVPFDEIKNLRLIRPVALRSRDMKLAEKGAEVVEVSSNQKFTVEFRDGERLSGATRGFIQERHGLYLYLVVAGDEVVRCFIPSSALADFTLSAALGQMLVAENAATQAQVEAGLELQQELRTQRIGDYLTANQIVSQERLQQVLRQQSVRPETTIGEALLQENLISKEQLDEALRQQSRNRRMGLGDILVDMGVAERGTVNRLLVQKLGIPFVNPSKFDVDPNALKLVDKALAQRLRVMPLIRNDNELVVAMENPLKLETIEALRLQAKVPIVPVMASQEHIFAAIDHHYAGSKQQEVLIGDLAIKLIQETRPVEAAGRHVTESDNTLVRLVNKIITDAYEQGVSDIHVESLPGNRGTQIRFRKDGALLHYLDLPITFRNALISRIKIMAALDISERRRPQDGKIDFEQFGTAKIELRVATMPTANGLEDVVMRVLAAAEPLPIERIGLAGDILVNLKRSAKRPQGLFLICGPTGSGKTTTLHSVLGYINTPDRKIWTAEDPIEITQSGLRQVQVNPKIGLTFAAAMRSFLRLDPDVIMVGEMRDAETARTGIEASLTGHLVFSTLHTNSATESVVRLLDFGMDPFNFADALLGVLSQRLARTLCTVCKQPFEASDTEVNQLLNEYQTGTPLESEALLEQWLNQFANESGKFTLQRAAGCTACDDRGYRGRIGLHELLLATPAIKKLIHRRATVDEMLSTAIKEGMRTLKQDGIEKILQGHTDVAQIRAVAA
ncbi:MAG TPA: ATPase, T2SS/T4P/T4SS family [Burkholderiales bacterium]|nr:ATPase, T2SS/T4P/T4SS family [Burkholderiales bacterium]